MAAERAIRCSGMFLGGAVVSMTCELSEISFERSASFSTPWAARFEARSTAARTAGSGLRPGRIKTSQKKQKKVGSGPAAGGGGRDGDLKRGGGGGGGGRGGGA